MDWKAADKAAWSKAAEKLEADGWKQTSRKMFEKDGKAVYLSRPICALNWQPQLGRTENEVNPE
jgi:hypothetical protein